MQAPHAEVIGCCAAHADTYKSLPAGQRKDIDSEAIGRFLSLPEGTCVTLIFLHADCRSRFLKEKSFPF